MRQPDITAFAGATHGPDERTDTVDRGAADTAAFDAPATRPEVEAQELFRSRDVERVPLFADEVREGQPVRIVAAYPG